MRRAILFLIGVSMVLWCTVHDAMATTVSWDLVKDRILPNIVSQDYGRGMFGRNYLAYRVIYQYDKNIVASWEMDTWKVSQAQLDKTAMANLRKFAGTLYVASEAGVGGWDVPARDEKTKAEMEKIDRQLQDNEQRLFPGTAYMRSRDENLDENVASLLLAPDMLTNFIKKSREPLAKDLKKAQKVFVGASLRSSLQLVPSVDGITVSLFKEAFRGEAAGFMMTVGLVGNSSQRARARKMILSPANVYTLKGKTLALPQ
ncbi:hypothetical protein HYW94_00385 [Candidatus Uhrbacteria bacterium]|nr:hypothetical protein [Candidatus Uhrbacteria bacterium]